MAERSVPPPTRDGQPLAVVASALIRSATHRRGGADRGEDRHRHPAQERADAHRVLTPPPREAILGAAWDQSEFVFTTRRRRHSEASTRAYHGKAVAAATGFQGDTYVGTRHLRSLVHDQRP